jgi:uncharacterized protein YcgI (DUF1989 family)
VLVYNAEHPTERLNVADTVKVQWQAYLGLGSLCCPTWASADVGGG